MSKIEVELPALLAEFLESQVEAGLYKSLGDAIEYAVRREFEDGADIDVVRAALAQGVSEADSGEYFDGTIEDIIAEAKAQRPSRK